MKSFFPVPRRIDSDGFHHFFDPTVQIFKHAIDLQTQWRIQTVLDAQLPAQVIELVLIGSGALAQTK